MENKSVVQYPEALREKALSFVWLSKEVKLKCVFINWLRHPVRFTIVKTSTARRDETLLKQARYGTNSSHYRKASTVEAYSVKVNVAVGKGG